MILGEAAIRTLQGKGMLKILNAEPKGILVPIVISMLTDGKRYFREYVLKPGESITAIPLAKMFFTASNSCFILPSKEALRAGLFIQDVLQANHAGDFEVHIRNFGNALVRLKKGDTIGYAVIFDVDYGYGDYNFYLSIFKEILDELIASRRLPFDFKEYKFPKFIVIRELIDKDKVLNRAKDIFEKLELEEENKVMILVSLVLKRVLEKELDEDLLDYISPHELRELRRIMLELYSNLQNKINLSEEDYDKLIRGFLLLFLLPQILYRGYLAVIKYEDYSDEMLYILKFFDDLSAEMYNSVSKALESLPVYERDKEFFRDAMDVFNFIVRAFRILRATDGLYNASYEDAMILYREGKAFLR